MVHFRIANNRIVQSAIGMASIAVCASSLPATLIFSKGEHTIDGAIGEDIVVENDAILNVVDPATIEGRISAYDTATVNLLGGFFSASFINAIAYDESTIHVSGGFYEERIVADDESLVEVLASTVILGNLYAQGHSLLRVYDNIGNNSVNAYEESQVELFVNASCESVQANDSSTVAIHGGSIENSVFSRNIAAVSILGGTVGEGIQAEEFGRIELFGDEFDAPFGTLTVPVGHLTGVLADGSLLDVSYFIFDDGEITLSPPPCPADIDGDSEVSFSDLLILLAQWGSCPPACFADVDDDGMVDFADLLYVLSAWGPCK